MIVQLAAKSGLKGTHMMSKICTGVILVSSGNIKRGLCCTFVATSQGVLQKFTRLLNGNLAFNIPAINISFPKNFS